MKTIEQSAWEFAEENTDSESYVGSTYSGFKEGVEFAQQFYLIERDQYADIDLNQKEELERNMPILVKYINEDGEITYDVFAEYYPVLQDPVYTHWRPIELK